MDDENAQHMHNEFWETLYEKQRLTKLLEKVNQRMTELSKGMIQDTKKERKTEQKS